MLGITAWPVPRALAESCPPAWTPGFGLPGVNDTLYALAVFDDGTGQALYAGGWFTTAGGGEANRIAKWDGTQWSALGLGMGGPSPYVHALTVFDDGTGPTLYAGGAFTTAGGMPANRIAKWDGTQWSALGGGMDNWVYALTVFDDGTGPALYAGGNFTAAGGVPANYIAKWDGTQWSALGSGMNSTVRQLTVFDDGSGPALYAGGAFTTAGGVPANCIAKWDGTQWSALGLGMGGPSPSVQALTVFDDGSGPALYAGGNFIAAGGVQANYVAKWDGTQWTALGSGMNSGVGALTVFDDGTGPALYAGGWFTTAGGGEAKRIAKWNGTQWSALGLGMAGNSPCVFALTVFDGGAGPALYAGGRFATAGGAPADSIAKWDGTQWSALGDRNGVNARVRAVTVFDDDGEGPQPAALYAGGEFTMAGGVPANAIAKWNGTQWSALGSGVLGGGYPYVYALTVFDDGTGPALYAAGGFATAGGVPANGIAKWNGTQWSALGSGMAIPGVFALTVFDDDGDGPHLPALYAGGNFTTAGGVPADRIAKWDGTQWSALGSGVNNCVRALTVFDDGTGPALYVGGDFTTAGGLVISRIAKWDGTHWWGLGGMSSYVYALTVFDDGSGPALYAGGWFTTAGGGEANRIAKWDDTQWSTLGSGANKEVWALTVFDEGTGPALYAGGSFNTAGGVASSYIARWGCQTSATDSDGDGIPNDSDNCPSHYNPSQADCDDDGIGDACQPGATDCNANGVPDSCDIDQGTSQDCTGNGIPDECEPDCNQNGVADSCDIAQGTSQDCTGNGIPDECEPDCNSNGIADSCDIAEGTSQDCTQNGIPDECESDCNQNGVADSCDVSLGSSPDCNANGIPDACDVASGASDDCQLNGIPDECERHGGERLRGRAFRGAVDGRVETAAARAVSLCQSPDQQAHGGAYLLALDADSGARAADGFTLADAATITDLSWWGTYRDACGEACTPSDDFTVNFYVNEDGLARKLVAMYPLGGTVQRTATGAIIGFETGFPEYHYSATLNPSLIVEPGKVYWVEIRNPVAFPCVWWWETAPPTGAGNGLALYDATGDGYAAGDAGPYDLAFCVAGLAADEDCNANGIDDAEDISGGSSADCQPNGIPDECEADRNVNGVPDDCDIIGGFSRDKNFNGVPDEADCPTRPGDLDGDCDVDLDDYAGFADCLGATGPELLDGCVCADLDLNGAVEIADYLAFATGADTVDEACRIPLPDACPDSWATSLGGREETFYDFGVHGPIPAGFFGEGSDPFGDRVVLVGAPVDPNDVHGETDTQIQHGPVIFDENGAAEVVLEITALGLQASEPIVVSYDRGRTTEEWLMVVGLSSYHPGAGVLTAQLDGPEANSGTYDATVYVQPLFLFVKVQDLLDGVLPECVTMRVLDTGESREGREALPPITLSFTDQPFVRTAGPEILEQMAVPDCAQGNFVPGVREVRGPGGSRAGELTCESHVTEGEAHYFCPPECKGDDVCRYVKTGLVTPLASCTNVPWFPAHKLGTTCAGGGGCPGSAFKIKPCPGGGFATQAYTYLACVERQSICQGSCCGEHGGCVLSTWPLCDGQYTGANSCSPDPCPPTGACCYEDGACDKVLAFTCDRTGGEYEGDDVSCTPNPCPRVDLVGHRPGTLNAPGPAVAEADEDAPDSLFAAVNDDNDDNGPLEQRDNRDNVIGATDDDVVKITLRLLPSGLTEGVVQLSVNPPDSLRLFKADGLSLLNDLSVDLASPAGDLAGIVSSDVDIFVEGKDVPVGDPVEDVTIRLTYTRDGTELARDDVHLRMTWIMLPAASIWNPFWWDFGNCGETELWNVCATRGFVVTPHITYVDPGNWPVHTLLQFFDDVSSRTRGILWIDGHGNAGATTPGEIPIETYDDMGEAVLARNYYINTLGWPADTLTVSEGWSGKWAVCITVKFVQRYCVMRDHSAVFLAVCYGAVAGGGEPSLADAFAGLLEADNSFGYDDISYTPELISDTRAIFETIGGTKPIGGVSKNYTIREAYDGGGIDENQAEWPAHLVRGDHTVDSVRMYVPR